MIYDNNFVKIDQVVSRHLYIEAFKHKGFTFIYNDFETIVLDKDNNVYAKLKLAGSIHNIDNLTFSIKKLGNKLYGVHGKSLVELDLNTLIKD